MPIQNYNIRNRERM